MDCFELITDRGEEYKGPAKRIIKLAIRHITSQIPRFQYAFDRFGYEPVNTDIRISTNGKQILYNPKTVVKSFRKEGVSEICRQLLHVLFHYLGTHIQLYRNSAHKKILSALIDAEVEEAVDALGLFGKGVHDRVNPEAGMLKTNNYYNIKYDRSAVKKITEGDNINCSDCHGFWLSESDDEEGIEDTIEAVFGSKALKHLKSGGTSADLIKGMLKENGIGKPAGESSGNAKEKYGARNSRTDYRDVIKQIINETQTEKESEEIIDKMIYTYGLELYSNVALIEPGEDEVDLRQIAVIVIAIDTSGSCSGVIAEHFLGELRQLLGQLPAFSGNDSEIILLECDCKIQSEKHYSIEKTEHMDMSGHELCGYGGTSFVPVFERIRQMTKTEDKRIDALIYISDGYGAFPDETPEFPVIFVLPDYENDDSDGPDIPEYVTVSYFTFDQ